MLFSYTAIALGFYAFAGIITKEYVEGFFALGLPWWGYSLLFWASVGFFAYFHIELSARILSYLLVLEVLAVLVYNIYVLSGIGLSGLDFSVFSVGDYLGNNLGLGILFTVILFIGFEATAIYREEIFRPECVIPKATYLVVVFIGLFYALTSWMMIQAMGVETAQQMSADNPAGVFLDSSRVFVGDTYNAIVAVLLLTSAFAAHLAIQNVIVRYVYSLSRDGVLPPFFGVAHDRHNSPHRASVGTSLVILASLLVLVLIGLTPEQIYAWFGGMGTYGILFAMMLTSGACVIYFARNPEPNAFVAERLIPVVATVLLAVSNWIAITNFDALTGEGGSLSLVMIASVFLFFACGIALGFWHKSRNPAVYARIGRQS